MRNVLYRCWAPEAAPLRIEFPPALLRQIVADGRPQHSGYLFGRRHGSEVRVLSAAPSPQGELRARGLELLGVYSRRPRGEVFLAETDLAELERVDGRLALVVAGGQAGFFPREADGSLRAVRSYEEFAVAAASAELDASSTRQAQAMPRWWRHPAIPPAGAWRMALGVLLLAAAPLTALQYLRELAPKPPLQLTMQEVDGQLVIHWDKRIVTERGARLEIEDAGTHTVLHVTPGTSSLTYALRSGDIEVRLSAEARRGTARWTSGKWGTLYNRSL